MAGLWVQQYMEHFNSRSEALQAMRAHRHQEACVGAWVYPVRFPQPAWRLQAFYEPYALSDARMVVLIHGMERWLKEKHRIAAHRPGGFARNAPWQRIGRLVERRRDPAAYRTKVATDPRAIKAQGERAARMFRKLAAEFDPQQTLFDLHG